MILSVAPAVADTTLAYSTNSLNSLDHYSMYTWRIGGVNLAGQVIKSATLSISQIYDWSGGTPADRLFIHLLDTAKYAGVASSSDPPPSFPTVNDNFNGANPLVASGTQGITLESNLNFPVNSPQNYTRSFTASELQTLTSYINNNGDFAFGFDPDCHYFDNGLTFQMVLGKSAPVPEPSSAVLLATLAGGILLAIRKLRTA